jgi:hypothetical protein
MAAPCSAACARVTTRMHDNDTCPLNLCLEGSTRSGTMRYGITARRLLHFVLLVAPGASGFFVKHLPLYFRSTDAVCTSITSSDIFDFDRYLTHDKLDEPCSLVETEASRNRRHFVTGVVLGLSLGTSPFPAAAAESVTKPESSALGVGLLESRVTENLLSEPTYGLEDADVFYPSWFSGTWSVESTTSNVMAPCGVALFGGNQTFQKALNDVGNTLRYESRFVTYAENPTRCIADREFNVKSIVNAAMGQTSVVDVSAATPNKFCCVLAPIGSPTLLSVDLITLNRRQETISETTFHCSEVVREIVARVGKHQAPTPTVMKEIETVSLYTFDPKTGKVRCRQRSAAFLLPSQQTPVSNSNTTQEHETPILPPSNVCCFSSFERCLRRCGR